MTQFLVVTGTHTDLSPPLGVLAVQPSDALLTTLATHRIFHDPRGPCAKIVDLASGEADPLFDAMLDPTNQCGSKLLHWLASLATQGCGIAAWAGTDASQLPQYTLAKSALTDLGPLPALQQPGDLHIHDNSQLVSLSGLAGVTNLRSLILEFNPILATLPELTDLTGVDGNLELRTNAAMTDLADLSAVTSVGGRLAVIYNPELLQTDAEAWAEPIEVGGIRKIVANKGYDQPPVDPCPWADDGECDNDVCVDDGWDCLSD